MAQKLILSINNTLVTAGFKNAGYRSQFGFTHYGADYCSSSGSTTVYANGNGTVVERGNDSVLGNVVVVKYLDVKLPNGNTIAGVVIRYYHLASIAVSKGQSVTKDTVLGQYGNTGQFSTGAHLHLEIDTDLNYPTYSPTLGSNSNIIKAGTDTVLNPVNVLFKKTTSPDNQTASIQSGNSCVVSSDASFTTY